MNIDGDNNSGAAEPSAKPTQESQSQQEKDSRKSNWSCPLNFFNSNQLPLLIVLAIVLAKAYPRGAEVLQADITATWIAVIVIFLISGLCLRWEELAKAFQRLKFNIFVQVFNFGFVSISVFGFSQLMEAIGAINSALADGMVICSCLPVRAPFVWRAINMPKLWKLH